MTRGVLLLAVLAGVTACHGPAPATPGPGGTEPRDAAVRDFVGLLDDARRRAGCATLAWDAHAARVAAAHSADMVRRGFFSHTNPEGADPFDRLRAAGLSFSAAAENIAFGATTGRQLFDQWLGSPGHRANMLNCVYTHHGLGRADSHWTHVLFRPEPPGWGARTRAVRSHEGAAMDEQHTYAILPLPDGPPPRAEDVDSPQSVVTALYDVVSGEPEQDQPRDWDRLRSLMVPGARFLLVRWVTPDGVEAEEEVLRKWDVEEFIEAGKAIWRETGFWEREIWNRTDRFGNVAHVLSTFESRVGSPESDPVSRGVNSFQLAFSRGRWWLASIVWDIEHPQNPIPPVYLQT